MNASKEEFLKMLSDYQGILHKVSLVYFKNKADREDNIQEIIYQLWKSYSSLKNPENIGSWVYRVAINTSLSRIKKKARIEYRKDIPEIEDKSDVAEEVAEQDSRSLLLKAIRSLDEIDRSIMLLYLEEKSYEEIAGITGISKSNVGVRINRVKKVLKQHLKKYDHGK